VKTARTKRAASSRRPPAPRSTGRLDTLDDLHAGLRSLRRTCPLLRAIHARSGDPPLRRRPGGLPGLARIIVGQQVSVASAESIWRRCEAVFSPFEAWRVAAAGDDDMRAAGLSRPKLRALRAAAEAVLAGLDLDALATVDAEAARSRLIAIPGIGPWSADIYLMFCQGRADVFAPGDLALKEVVRVTMNLDARPSTEALAEIAARWSPWRAVAAHLLWHEYALMKAAAGAPA
jgi:DNA-3-methyladenine glycosylase II